MSPIAAASQQWFTRDDSDDDGDDEYCTGWCTSDNTRWIIAAVIIAVVVVLSILTWFYSIRRATGVWALTARRARQQALDNGGATSPADAEAAARGAGRRRRPRGRRNQFEADADPVPTYHATLGDGDAGHYDEHGNYMAFEPPPYEPPKAVLHVSAQETDAQEMYELGHYRTASVSEEFEPIDARGAVTGHRR